jgi:hypothetical protein
MLLTRGHPFFGHSFVTDATGTAAKGCAIASGNCVPVHYPAILIHVVVESSFIEPHDCSVVFKIVAMPPATHKADAHVAEAIIHAAIVANVVTPIAIVEDIETVVPAPVAWRPQRAFIGSWHPCSGNPIVAIAPVGPVAGCPHQTGFGARRLFIDR